MAYEQFNEQEQNRRNALTQLRELGIDPYPAALYPVNTSAKSIEEGFNKEEAEAEGFDPTQGPYSNLCIAGRIMSRRIMGAASFCELQDSTGRIQIYIKRDEICPSEDKTMYNTVWKRLLDIGDIVGIKGFAFFTQTGQLSIHAKELTLLSKSLRVLPIVKEADGVVHDAVTDPELRYRQRYVDLIINPQMREVFVKRTQIINTMRKFCSDAGYLEVETPILQSIPGGANARPFITHHNALDIPLYLRVANELYLKRLIVGGYDGVFEFAKDFRNEGMDKTHNPEFTQLELYVAYTDYIWMMDFAERMIEKVALDLNGTTVVEVDGKKIDFKAGWKRIRIMDAIKEYAGVDVHNMDEEELRTTCKKLNVEFEPGMGRGKLIDAIFSAFCEDKFVQPTFLIDYPVEMSPLTKRCRYDDTLTERFEIFVNGHELANAYSELNDPIDQLERFKEEAKLKMKGDDEAMFVDYDFVRALEYGMPPTAGIGIGIDRLAMLMLGQRTIQDVLFFPQMRPEKGLAETYATGGSSNGECKNSDENCEKAGKSSEK